MARPGMNWPSTPVPSTFALPIVPWSTARPVDVASGDRDTAATRARRRNEARVDAGPVSIRPADRPALIRTTDLPALQLRPIDVLAVERDPARSPSSAGNEAVLDARPIEPRPTDRRRSGSRTPPGRDVCPVEMHRRSSAGAGPGSRHRDDANQRDADENGGATFRKHALANEASRAWQRRASSTSLLLSCRPGPSGRSHLEVRKPSAWKPAGPRVGSSQTVAARPPPATSLYAPVPLTTRHVLTPIV